MLGEVREPAAVRVLAWDDSFVYHVVDHALDGDSDESYRLTDGRWLPRRLAASATAASPWTLDVAANDLIWYDASCRVDPSRSHAFPYRMRAWIQPSVDAGRDLGVRDALMFDYEPYDPAAASPGASERFTIALGAGWFRWERGRFVDLFERLGGPAVQVSVPGTLAQTFAIERGTVQSSPFGTLLRATSRSVIC